MNFKNIFAGVMCLGFLSGCINGADSDGLLSASDQALKAASLSDADVRSLSAKSCAQMDKQSSVAAPGSAYSKRLAKVVQGLPTTVDGQKINYRVYMTSDVNAWAMPNGCVRVYSGLMDMMDDDELRGVIGHEIAHVGLGHSKKAMQLAYGVSAARTAAGATSGVASKLSNSQLGDLGEKLVNSQFSQSQEMDADNYSFDLLTSKGFSAKGLATGFQKFADMDGGKSSMLSSHPSSSERVKNIETRLAAGK